MNALFAVALKEFQDGLRNRWLLSITFIFAVLAIGLSYYGSAASGQLGVASLSTTIASLSSLAVFLIPLIALLLSYDSFVGEQESGTLLLLMTYPLSHRQLLLGKFFGQGTIIGLATSLGFGSAAMLMAWQTGASEVLPAFGLFILSAILLGLCFIAIAYVISLSVSEKSKAAGIALLLWFFFVLVFDLALLALLIGVEEGLSQSFLVQLMWFNPADLFRLINLAALDTGDVNGVVAVALEQSQSLAQLFLIMLGWVLAPLALAALIFHHKKL
ncbi:ABC transporter permease [Photobacterium sp. TY1-4]|uniref:ABC transporter permease n=1 Tax=Photobacterium sp. TY1-4 TaxID=2899122 RepID=UPI0021BE32E3|nr:ABC transporter permease [Photobacterium sp. TY1-4]UXI03490.1 ABC transporter permease [Photobacterium sp. TY1-4]